MFSWMIYCPAELPARQARPRKAAKEMTSLRDQIKPIGKIAKPCRPRADKVAHAQTRPKEKREGFSERLAQSGHDLGSRFQFRKSGLESASFPSGVDFLA